MNIAIIDDIKDERTELENMLSEYFRAHNISPVFAHFSSGEEWLKGFEKGRFDCAFIDIYMDGMDGMAAAREVYKRDKNCRLIFCTSSISHAVSSYEVRASWYLTKPYSRESLWQALDIVLTDIIKDSRGIAVHVKGNEVFIRLDEVYFTDSLDRKARVHLKDRMIEVDEAVSEVENALRDECFLVCNRNTTVNMDHIALTEEDDFLLDNGERVPLRQRGRAALKKEYLAYSLRSLRRG